MNTVQSLVEQIDRSFLSLEAYKQKETVIGVLDQFFKSVKIDTKLGRRLYHFQIGYINTSKDYVEFFGSNLIGTHVIRFRDADVLRFFNEVLELDYDDLEKEIRKCDTIVHSRLISSDIFNLTVIYLVHRCMSEKTLSDKDRKWLAYNASLIFFYRALAAIMSAWFTYPTDPKIAQAAYANLSYKFLIKRLGNWHKVMDYRANELIAKDGTQYNKLYKLVDDLDLVDVINDCANSIRDMMKNYYAEFVKVHSQGERIGVTFSTGLDLEGEEVVKDKIRDIDKYIAGIKSYLSDQNAFVRDDLIRVISDLNRNTSPRLLKETLVWVSQNSGGKDYKLIDETITKIVIYSFYLIQSRLEADRTKDISYVLIQLKNLYLSSRSTDDDLIDIRNLCDKILVKVHHELSTPLMLATRTAFILYVIFRALVNNKTK